MVRHNSGTFRRADRVSANTDTPVRVVLDGRRREINASLLELGMTDLVLTAAEPLLLGTRVSIAITLKGRYLEFEIPGMVGWHRDGMFGISFDYLSARQTYGLALTMDLMRSEADDAAAGDVPARFRLGQR